MRVIRYLERIRPELRRTVATLGVFDGVHIGHSAILERVVVEAKNRAGSAVVFTFFPHPAVVLAPGRAPAPISTLGDRLGRFREAGIDVAVVQRFTAEFSRVDAEEFVERILVGALAVERVIVGPNVSFGRDRGGNTETLIELGARHGFAVEIVGPILADGAEASSSAIRRRLGEGDLAVAAKLLGRPYSVAGRVIVGKRRGRTIGFPTANVRSEIDPLLPDGVYAVTAIDGEVRRPGVANLGRNPTFGDLVTRSLEVHVLDFDGDLYGRRLRVEFVLRIRGETRFASIDALVAQIRGDAARAREILGA